MATESPDLLLVEDNPDDVELTLRAFKRARLANPVHVACDGVEALEFLFPQNGMARAVLPRVVLLDLKLPRVNGLEVLARIRANERTKRLPVVVVTSSREEADILKACELGVNSYIVKPVEFEKFVAVVGEVGLYWLTLNQASM
ncbi:MAG: response regulator [Holophagales bacterium]|jgi:two-component system response regulator|nr:response regulator [Holophagales bacterium]